MFMIRNRKLNTTKLIFLIYCLILIWIVLLKMAFSLEEVQMLLSPRRINWIPFHYDADVGRFHTKEVIMNVLIFVPLGLYLRMLDVTGRKVILWGAISSLALELCQFLFAIGASDTTDILTNTFGTTAGVCLYALARKVFSDKPQADRVINTVAAIALVIFFALVVLLLAANL